MTLATVTPYPEPNVATPLGGWGGNGLGDAPGSAPSPGLAITIGDDGQVHYGPAPKSDKPRGAAHFDDNLADQIASDGLSTIANDLIEAVEADDASRKEWIAQYSAGMELLGLTVEQSASASGGTKSVSRIRHPLLLWAVVKGQSQARAELLPASGPVKVEVIGPDSAEKSERGEALESDMNAWLTSGAPEYYPDMDRGLFYLYYGGVLFKKGYRCPVRERPVCECVYAPDLIVSNDATDLANAARVTHRIEMPPHVMRDMMETGAYLDVPLGLPMPQTNPAALKEAQISGIAATPERPKDKPHTVYEIYTDLDLSAHGIESKTKRSLPYRVTIERDSRRVLEVRRNWKQHDPKRKARKRFVKYGLIPGFGFYDYGFLHLLGNHAKVLTALSRMVIDAAMFANFPGGMKLKGARTSNNEIAPGPGEWVDVEGVDDIRKIAMPMPYKDPSPVILQMIDSFARDGAQMAGTVDIEVGEGRTNVPVGTIMAMIEQQTQVMAACHKRLHTAQAEEFALLKELFQEDPEAIVRGNRNPARMWQAAQELDDLDLVPASDPNVPSHIHRLQRATALIQMGQSAPQLFNLPVMAEDALTLMGIGDAKKYLLQPGQGAMPPQQQGAMPPGGTGSDPAAIAAELKAKQADLQAKGEEKQQDIAFGARKLATETQQEILDRQSKENIANLNAQVKREQIAADQMKHDREIQSRAALANMPEPGVME